MSLQAMAFKAISRKAKKSRAGTILVHVDQERSIKSVMEIDRAYIYSIFELNKLSEVLYD